MNPYPNTCDAQDGAETVPALNVESILAIHRDPAGYVGFVRKSEKPKLDKYCRPYIFENLCSIQAGELREVFPAIAEWLTHDSYFTVNAYYRAAPFQNKTTGLPNVWRKEKHLSKLTACYSDIDCGRPESDEPGADSTWRQAQYDAELLADEGVIPQPSIMARSGRGVYLLWLLRDPKDPTKLQQAWPEKIELYKTINRALNERLRTHRLPANLGGTDSKASRILGGLPADQSAIDAARVLRTPGSIHRKAMRRVSYVIQLGPDGKGFVYTLPELAKFLNLQTLDSELPDGTRALARPAHYRKVKNPGSAPLRSNGWKQRNALRAQDLLTIETWRGGFLKRGVKYPDGTNSLGRRFMLTLYAQFLRGAGAEQAAILAALGKMAANMKPAYPSDTPDQDPPIESIVSDSNTAPRLVSKSNAKLCAMLGITAQVARDLELKTIRPAEVAIAEDQARPLQADLIQQRREFTRQYVEKYGLPTIRWLKNLYKAHGFMGANHETANQDLKAIFPNAIRPRGGRPRKPQK